MIELENVSKFYNNDNIVTIGLRNINLKFNKGEFVAITGDSGSGKSTLLNIISSIDNYDEGEIYFYGNETFYFNQNDSDNFRKNNVSFIFQKYNIIESYTVLQNVMLPLLIKGKTAENAKNEAIQIIKKVGLLNRKSHKGSTLSGGEKQRCVIARALANDAKILACDEPTGNLDKKTSEEIIKLIKEVSKDKLVLYVTHDYESVKEICTRKIKLSDGEVVEDVSFSDGIKEDNKTLSLIKDKPSLKTLLKLSFVNIMSTPKKTVFTTLVFTFVSCVLLLLSLLTIKISYNVNYTYNNAYGICSEDRMIIYSYKNKDLNNPKLLSLLKDYEYYENAFYEEMHQSVQIKALSQSGMSITFHHLDYRLIEGKKPTNDKEFILVVNDEKYYNNYRSSYYFDLLGRTIEMTANKTEIGKIVGVGISSEVKKDYIIAHESNKNLINIIVNNNMNMYYISDDIKASFGPIYRENIEKSYIAVPTKYKDNIEFEYILRDIYKFTYDLDIVYTDEEYAVPTMIVNDDFINGEISPISNGIKEITVYTDNVIKLSKEVKSMGYNVSIPSLSLNENSINMILVYLSSFIIFVILSIFFFVSFVIIQRIYISKIKDYSIFRTLGLMGKDLKKILLIEIGYIAILAILIGMILSYIIIEIFKMNLLKYLSTSLIFAYVLIILAFSLLLAQRLNKKTFRKTIYQSIKEGSE